MAPGRSQSLCPCRYRPHREGTYGPYVMNFFNCYDHLSQVIDIAYVLSIIKFHLPLSRDFVYDFLSGPKTHLTLFYLFSLLKVT